MGQVLHRGLFKDWEPVGGGRIVGVETCVHNELAEVGSLQKVTEGDFVRSSGLLDPRRECGNLTYGSV